MIEGIFLRPNIGKFDDDDEDEDDDFKDDQPFSFLPEYDLWLS